MGSMRLIWSNQSVQALEKVIKFYKRIAGEEVAIKIENQIIQSTVKLEKHSKVEKIKSL